MQSAGLFSRLECAAYEVKWFADDILYVLISPWNGVEDSASYDSVTF